MTDDDIDYTDIPPLTEEFFKNATLRIPASQARDWVKLEPGIIEWFQAQGTDYKALVNQALHNYIADHSSRNGG
ncbi:MAG: BrnA antitoxin family protein [Phormidesmis sp.]